MRIASPAVEEVPQAEEEQTTMRVPSDEESPAGSGSDTVATPTPADSMPEAGLDLPAFSLLATFGPRDESTLQIANNETREGYLRACTLVETLAEVRALACGVVSLTRQAMHSGSTTTNLYRSP